mmetsp:Transcript_11396/g.26324  ORF Transcript_11396/g.26324 Transcript_11396/m.26324 type:complete len:87 (+) Transcript_11396:101-361(+)
MYCEASAVSSNLRGDKPRRPPTRRETSSRLPSCSEQDARRICGIKTHSAQVLECPAVSSSATKKTPPPAGTSIGESSTPLLLTENV